MGGILDYIVNIFFQPKRKQYNSVNGLGPVIGEVNGAEYWRKDFVVRNKRNFKL